MKNKKTDVAIAALCFAALIIISLVFANSMKDHDASYGLSGAIIDMIVPDGADDNGSFELIVRKIAHLVEYALLGTVVMSLVIYIRRRFGKSYLGAALFCVLAAAVADEHIQSFSDRSSSTGDIILDFVGAMIGFLLTAAVVFIVGRCESAAAAHKSKNARRDD